MIDSEMTLSWTALLALIKTLITYCQRDSLTSRRGSYWQVYSRRICYADDSYLS